MPAKPVYDDDEVGEILRRAIERQQHSSSGLRRDELVAAAAEIGIDASYVDHAIDEIEAERRAAGAGSGSMARVPADGEQAIRRRLRNKLARHVAIWLIVSTALFLMNALSSPGHWWFYWPLLGWGIGVGIHAVNALFPSESAIEHEERMSARRDRKRRRRDREFELAVEKGVEKMLTRGGDRPRVELPAAPRRGRRPPEARALDADDEAIESDEADEGRGKRRAAR